MTVEREEPGLLVATCDGCGERLFLDAEPGATEAEISEELSDADWRQDAPVKQAFPDPLHHRHVETYPQDFCPDCQTAEPKPAPRFGSGRRPDARPSLNDPCDEWPRALIFAAAGLRADCGHPIGDAMCALCLAGHPIGSSGPWWRR